MPTNVGGFILGTGMYALPRRSAWPFVLSAGAALWPSASALGEERLLTRADEVRALTQEEAAQGLLVRLRGVVLGEAEPPKPERGKAALVILDDTEGIYLWGPRPLASGIQRGDVIEVEGVSDPEPEPLRPGDEVKNLVDGARLDHRADLSRRQSVVDEWAAAFTERGGRSDDWHMAIALPSLLQRLDHAARLDHRMITARSVWLNRSR